MYIIDSILKNVQGNYVTLFETQISQVFRTAFTQARTDDERKSLIKLFNVWSLLFDPAVLDSISTMLNLKDHVSSPLPHSY